MAWRLPLHHRIGIPFAIVALVATSASAFLAVAVVSRAFQARIQTQILNTSDVISRGGFAFNPAILRSVKAITGADVITFEETGAIVTTTVEPQRGALIQAVVRSALTSGERADGTVREIPCDQPCYVSYRSVSDRPGVLVAVVVQAAETAEAIRAVSRTIVLAALAAIAALVLVSQLVARRLTAPLDSLVRFTQDVGGGARRRAKEGDDEVGRLGRAFNEMLDRLDDSKILKVRHEKLALAGLFAARVAHDIRNPLASMKINTQLLEKSVGSREPFDYAQGRQGAGSHEKNADLVNAVLYDISQVESVIRDLIELARPSELKLVPVDLNAVVRTVLRQLESRLTHRKVVASLDLPERLPLVMTDAQRFSQALINVIVNASDAMPNGGALVVRTRAEGGDVVIDVEDEGVGIDPALADRVFDPFVSSKPEGVGLGLVNARAVVEGHGGRITLTPRQPQGTRARIVMPVNA